MKDIENLISGAARYLLHTRLCDEDQIAHNGRRAYALPLLRWLYEKSANRDRLEDLLSVSKDLSDVFEKDSDGDIVVFPGSLVRRNYSTNAIDCGIFVDSVYDIATLLPKELYILEEKASEIAQNFISKKIISNAATHNQYLWAATGLANWVFYNKQKAASAKYKKQLEQVLEYWITHNEKDGYSPYLTGDSHLDGLAPYYLSRCIAFSFYILEKASIDRPDIERFLERAALFLVRLSKNNGVKEISLETKRYYFSGSHEVGSHPYDIYVFWKMFERTHDEFWVNISSISLQALIKSQRKNGAVSGKMEEEKNRDWQCDTMRTGHLAWLTRIPDSFLTKITEKKNVVFSFPEKYTMNSEDQRILIVGEGTLRHHFVTRKCPIHGFAGERSSGFISKGIENINNLSKSLPYHYRTKGKPFLFLKNNILAINASSRHAVYHAWDYFFYKKDPQAGFNVLKHELFQYLWIGMFSRSTEFILSISNLNITDKKISHNLEICALDGTQKEVIGKREISWDKTAITVCDSINTNLSLIYTTPSEKFFVSGRTERVNTLQS